MADGVTCQHASGSPDGMIVVCATCLTAALAKMLDDERLACADACDDVREHALLPHLGAMLCGMKIRGRREVAPPKVEDLPWPRG